MIENDSLKAFNERALEQLAELCDVFDCAELPCSECPFALSRPYKVMYGEAYICAFAFAAELHRRLTK